MERLGSVLGCLQRSLSVDRLVVRLKDEEDLVEEDAGVSLL